MAYNKKKYIRINWKNRPSTATALGATNLNHMDVFLNDVDNALIEMDSGKLNVETANSMIASITFDKDKGLMTVRELNGTTYTYDWNVEKIPVSFSLSEDGILTMTTQDGTQFTANIADLIKDLNWKRGKTMSNATAQLAIMSWIENHMGATDIDIRFNDKREAFITDGNGNTISLKYDNNTKEVYAI